MSVVSSYRHSVFSRLTIGLTLIPLMIFTLVMAWQGWRTQGALGEEIANQINDDMAALAELYIGEGPDRVANAVNQRLALSPLNRAGAHYRWVDSSGTLLAGDLALNASSQSDLTRSTAVKDTQFGALLLRSTIFKGGEVLTVARETDAGQRALSESLWNYVMGVGAILILSMILVGLSVKQLRRRIALMNDVFIRVGDGDTDARLFIQARPDELTRLADHINLMIKRTARLLTLRKRVTDQVAHEMRSPLTRLDASLVRIENEVGRRDEIDHARDELKHCVTLLDGLLDMSSIDAQKGDRRGFETVNMTALTGSIVELFEPLAEDENKSLKTMLDANIYVAGAPSQLGRLVSNLLDNAIKYAADETVISVSLVAEGQSAVLRVANDGEPISAETARDIFTPFFRNPDMSDKKGYGLGLAISRAIAVRHDGFLEFEPTPKQIVFKLILPILPDNKRLV